MSPFVGFLLFLAGYPLVCIVSLLGLLGSITVLKLNGPPKLAFGLLIIPLGVILLVQLFGLFIASAPSSLLDIIQWIATIMVLVVFVAPGIYLNRKLSQKFSLSRDESIKAIVFFFISGLIGGVVMGLTIPPTSNEGAVERFDSILFLIVMPLGTAVLYTIVGWLIIRRFSKSPSRLTYILPDWLLRLFDPFYIPPYGKKQHKNKIPRHSNEQPDR